MSITSLHCRGLLGRSIVTAQAASPIFTHVYVALVAIVNTKFPQIGELIIKRVIVNFKKGYRRNDKVSNLCIEMCTIKPETLTRGNTLMNFDS